jgi:diguanylate cyclase (GGDEF)-like protein
VKEISSLEGNSWQEKQAREAKTSGLAIVVRDGDGRVVSMSNNNSMCRSLYTSPEFAPACEQFCGKAFEWAACEAARKTGKIVAYRCHAGLDCRAVLLETEAEETGAPPTRLVAIVGRTFTKPENYRAATARAVDGDWKQFSPTDFFANVLLSSSENDVKLLAERLKYASDEEKQALAAEAAVAAGEAGKIYDYEPFFAARHESEKRGTPETENELAAILNKRETTFEEETSAPTNAVVAEKEAERQPSDTGKQSDVNVKIEEVIELAEQAQRSGEDKMTAAKTAKTAAAAATMTARNSPDKFAARHATAATTEGEDIGAWRSLFGSLLNITYQQACASVLQFLSERYDLPSLAWLERRENGFEIVAASGALRDRQARFEIAADDARLAEAAQRGGALELQERADEEDFEAEEADECGEYNENDADEYFETQQIAMRFFPVAVGGEIRSALVLGDDKNEQESEDRNAAMRHLIRFCRAIAPELEILHLREEVARRGWLESAVRRFNENLRKIDSEDFWLNLTQTSAELMKAERGSLLIFDEKSSSLVTKAAVGATADRVKNERETLGARVAARVFEEGVPVVVGDVEKIGVPLAPADWKYKSKSFISFPIEIGGRRIGVLNLTERADGGVYNEMDLDLLRSIVPQLAVLIDRAALQRKAGEFEQLSVTDALTGLLNRRYLEERLTEEIKRSNRHGFSMSFMMIDVDEFKSYNDNFSHPEGDKALKLVAQCLKDTLRGADIASRYGGEEFSILLPQTTAAEAAVIAERVRERVDRAQFPNRKVTVSIGVASCSHIDRCTASGIVKAADAALYEAKRHGKNIVRNYGNLKENL